jgi:NifU-like protein involved in Fe-S cluster formation
VSDAAPPGRGAAGPGCNSTFELEPAPYPERRIAAARFLAFACPHTIAVAAWVAERAVGEVCAAGLPESVHAISRRFEVPAEKLGRLLIVEDAWAAAVAAAKLRVTM